jgi:hypothetical protein
VCTLAHVFEGLGFSTIALASVRSQAERVAAPRTLYCDFPLGRPLGRPNDATFQTDVLSAAFALLREPTGPVFVDYPVAVTDDGNEQLSCTLPPRFDPAELPAVDEANAVAAAYRRTVARNDGRTSVGRVMSAEAIGGALRSFDRIASGTPWKEAGLPADPMQCAMDVRVYYAEAALSLVESGASNTSGAWATEAWFYEQTHAGQLILRARQAMKDADAPFPIWFYMAPLDR